MQRKKEGMNSGSEGMCFREDSEVIQGKILDYISETRDWIWLNRKYCNNFSLLSYFVK